MPMQVRRTLTVGAVPTGLAEGQISVGMADAPPTGWVGVPTSVNPAGVIPITGLVRTVAGAPQPAGSVGQLWWDEDAAQLFVYTGAEWVVAVNPPMPDVSGFLAKSGGTLTGPLILSGDATNPLGAVTLEQLLAATGNPQGGGQLRIAGANPGNLLGYFPFNGNAIRINGVFYDIPTGGVICDGLSNGFVDGVGPQPLPFGVLLYVYLFNNGGTLALDFSATGHVTSATPGNEGVEIKAGDDSRTLVGLISTQSGLPVFINSATYGYVRSWLNRERLVFRQTSGGSDNFTGNAWTNTAAFGSVVTFAEPWFATVEATAYGGTGNVFWLRGTIDGNPFAGTQFGATGTSWFSISASQAAMLAEGQHPIYAQTLIPAGTFVGQTAVNAIIG